MALAASVATVPPADAADGDRIMGFSLGPFAQREESVGVELRRVKATGANMVAITQIWEADETKNVVAPGSQAKNDAQVIAGIRAVRRAGMEVALLPIFTCPKCEVNWRGAVRPTNKTLFYESYRSYIDRYAKIAGQEGVDLFFIGSEMTSTQRDTDEWRKIAAVARASYGGALAYDVNWDATEFVAFWDVIDVPSVSAYYPLSDDPSPSLAELKAAWTSSTERSWRGRNSVAFIERLAAKTGKRILFGEVGYRSRDFSTRKPFDFTGDSPPNQELQADAYQAVLEVFDPKPWWRGVLWWEWDLTTNASQETGYTPRAKPAEEVLTAWFVRGERPTADRPRLGESPRPVVTVPPGATARSGAEQPRGVGPTVRVPGAAQAPSATLADGTPAPQPEQAAAAGESAAPERRPSSKAPVAGLLGGAAVLLAVLAAVGTSFSGRQRSPGPGTPSA